MPERVVVLDMEFNLRAIEKKGKEYQVPTEIIQIGAVKLDENLKSVEEFSCYVRPQMRGISDYCTEITGITDEQVADASPFRQSITHFLDWIGDDISQTYIYTWSGADLEMVRKECRNKKIEIEKLNYLCEHWVDYQKRFGDALGYPVSLSLNNALLAIDIHFEGQMHDALADARNTAKLIQAAEKEKTCKKKMEAFRFFFEKKEQVFPTLGEVFQKEFAQCAMCL